MAIDQKARDMIAVLKAEITALTTKVTKQAARITALEDAPAAGDGADMVARVGGNVLYATGQLTVKADTVIGLVE